MTELEKLRVEVSEWRACARYTTSKDGTRRFDRWALGKLGTCRVKYVEGDDAVKL